MFTSGLMLSASLPPCVSQPPVLEGPGPLGVGEWNFLRKAILQVQGPLGPWGTGCSACGTPFQTGTEDGHRALSATCGRVPLQLWG